MFGREPVIIAAAIAAIAQGALIFVYGDVSATLVGWEVWLVPLVTMVAGFFGRQKVVSKETVLDAGMSVVAIKSRASDPNVPRKEG